MYNLLQNYRKELCKELVKLYFKSIIVSEYISIFPNLRSIKFSNDLFPKYIKKIIETKYLSPLLAEIANRDILSFSDIENLISTATTDVLNKIYSNESFSFLDNFANSFKKYQSEPFIAQTNENYFLNEEKYKYNNFYIEIYFRLIDHPQPPSDPTPMQLAIMQRHLTQKFVVSPTIFYEFVKYYKSQQTARRISDEAFFRLFSDIRIGARLMFNPFITQNKEELFGELSNKDFIKNEKFNAIKGKYNDQENELYYFPLKIAEKEFTLFTSQDQFIGIRRTLDDILIFIESNILNNNQKDINKNSALLRMITSKLWTNDSFKKLFKYHIPINVFEVLLPQDQLLSNKLLNRIYEENLPYKNLNSKIINLINRILNAEDPNKI